MNVVFFYSLLPFLRNSQPPKSKNAIKKFPVMWGGGGKVMCVPFLAAFSSFTQTSAFSFSLQRPSELMSHVCMCVKNY
jgi:hypothetical protein